MTAPQPPIDRRRFRLAGNDNETIIEGDADIDVEGHRLAGNDDETVVGTDERDGDDAGDPTAPPTASLRR